jgi:thiamine-phosphate pyrophosphorylase
MTRYGRAPRRTRPFRRYGALGVDRPWFGIGGIDLSNLEEVMSYGVSRVVVVRAITDAEDPGAAAAEFAKRLTPSAP